MPEVSEKLMLYVCKAHPNIEHEKIFVVLNKLVPEIEGSFSFAAEEGIYKTLVTKHNLATELGLRVTTIRHGSPKVIKVPVHGQGAVNNDYGQGFYCTKDKGLAGEWAVYRAEKDGYINEYYLLDNDLSILYLDKQPLEQWVATLMKHRKGDFRDPVLIDRISLFVKKYYLDISEYDVIIGYRADDAFFSYIEQFVSVTLSIEKLKEAMQFGNLGLQIALMSKKALDNVHFLKSEVASFSRYFPAFEQRDRQARQQFWNMKDRTKGTLILKMIGEI